MYDRTLKNVVAIVFVLGHLSLLGQVAYYWGRYNRFTFEEVMDSALVITPMLGAYIASMVRYITLAQKPPRGVKRGPPHLLITGIVISVFFGALFAVASAKSSGRIPFVDYKRSLAAIDTVFAVYFSSIITSLFEGAGVPQGDAARQSHPPAPARADAEHVANLKKTA